MRRLLMELDPGMDEELLKEIMNEANSYAKDY